MYFKKFMINIFFMFISFAQIKTACIGDSITFGFTILNRRVNSYPAGLAQLLGECWKKN
jgi:hypothetical protein